MPILPNGELGTGFRKDKKGKVKSKDVLLIRLLKKSQATRIQKQRRKLFQKQISYWNNSR
jgi:hypothetical protein